MRKVMFYIAMVGFMFICLLVSRIAGTGDHHSLELLMIPDGGPNQLCRAHINGGVICFTIKGLSLQHIAWSPDGNQIAFSETDYANSKIYIVDNTGYNLHKLHTDVDVGGESNPIWSPDGTKIAFEARTYNHKSEVLSVPHIFIIDIDGKNLKEIAQNGRYPQWSSHNLLAFINRTSGNVSEITITNKEGNVLMRKSVPAFSQIIEWSPDSNNIMYVGFSDALSYIRILDIHTASEKSLVRGSYDVFSAKWSPDGSKIALIGTSNNQHTEICIVEVVNGHMEELNYEDIDRWYPVVWAPDSQTLAFNTYSGNVAIVEEAKQDIFTISPKFKSHNDIAWRPFN